MANPNPERLYNARNISEYVEIENYTSTIRTNSDFQPSGLQTTAFIKNTLNVPLSYDDTALNWDGGSYGDTQKKIDVSKDFTITAVLTSGTTTKQYTMNGVQGADGNYRVLFGFEEYGNGLYFRIGSYRNAYTAVSNLKEHIQLTYNSTEMKAYFYLNGLLVGSGATTLLQASSAHIGLGVKLANGQVPTLSETMETPVDFFEFSEEYTDSTAALEAYNKWIGA